MPGRTRKAQPPRKHALFADGSIPPDPYSGLQRCRRCKVMGRPGDGRHTDEFPETPEEDRSAQILGEG